MALAPLINIHLETIRKTPLDFKRYLYPDIHWDSRLIGIIGARGVGKTTLLLQYYKEHFSSPQDCLYITADHVMVQNQGLFATAQEFFQYGGHSLMIDEIHKYPNWLQELKNIYDTFQNANIIFSGSSALSLSTAHSDLARRADVYELRGLSFREYLSLQTKTHFNTITLDDLLTNHLLHAQGITQDIRVLKHFEDYLIHGYYPYYLEGPQVYLKKLHATLEAVIYQDIPSLYNTRPQSLQALKKLIYLISCSQPFTPNIEKLSAELKLSKPFVYQSLEHLTKANILLSLFNNTKGFNSVRKPQKIYLENPNLFYAISGSTGLQTQIGSIRECFFANQLSCKHSVNSVSQMGDFFIDKKFLFEVGGKKKNQKQIHSQKNAYLACDNIEVGFENKIPLWLFGMLY